MDRQNERLALAQVSDTLFATISKLFALKRWYFLKHFGSCFVVYLVFADWPTAQQIDLEFARQDLLPKFDIDSVSDFVFSFMYFITVVDGSAL